MSIQAALRVRQVFTCGQNLDQDGTHQGRHARRGSGLQAEEPTIATALKDAWLRHGAFGKNHPGDRDELLTTAHPERTAGDLRRPSGPELARRRYSGISDGPVMDQGGPVNRRVLAVLNNISARVAVRTGSNSRGQ